MNDITVELWRNDHRPELRAEMDKKGVDHYIALGVWVSRTLGSVGCRH
jgi:hypothetical protein